MKKIIILIIILTLGSCNSIYMHTFHNVYRDTRHTATAEYFYMLGQKDALTGNISIKEVDGDWRWIKSPWSEGTAPIFDYISLYQER